MTMQEMAAEYLELVGYDPIADCPEITYLELADLLEGAREYNRQVQS